MDYVKIYEKIIKQAKHRELEGYGELHHIIPKCVGGSDEKSNIVKLTAKEHFICHLVLLRIYPDSQELQYAAWAMANQTNNIKQNRNYKVSSRTYEELRQLAAKNTSERLKGKLLTESHRNKMSATRTGQKKSTYKKKELKFQHKCESCTKLFKSADSKGKFCPECKKPRKCVCGCGQEVKTAGKLYARGCKTRGKTYSEIYKEKTPTNGFKKGNKFGKLR